jgi:hypothetical protein
VDESRLTDTDASPASACDFADPDTAIRIEVEGEDLPIRIEGRTENRGFKVLWSNDETTVEPICRAFWVKMAPSPSL